MLDSIYLLALFTTLSATGIGLGLAHPPASVLAALRQRRRLAALILVNIVAVPLFVRALVLALGVPEGFAAGLALVGAASAGPLGLKVASIGQGDVPLAIGAVVVLEGLNTIAIPVWLAVLRPATAAVPISEIVLSLVLAVLLPLAIGSALGTVSQGLRTPMTPVADIVSTIGLGLVVAAVVVRDAGVLLDVARSGVVAAALGTIAFGLVAGRLAGGAGPAGRTGALVTAFRASGPALAAATAMGAAASQATAAIVAFALVGIVVAIPVAAVLARAGTGRDRAAAALRGGASG